MAKGVSGKYGQIRIGSTVIAECMDWRFSRKANVTRYASNQSSGFKRAVTGTRMADVTFKGMFDPTTPIYAAFDEGDSVTMHLVLDAGGRKFVVPVVIESLEIGVDFDDGKPVDWSATAASDGAWTEEEESSS